MKKSILISIILIVVLAVSAILVVPKFSGGSGVKVSADTVEKDEEAVQTEENDSAPVEEAAPAIEEEPDATPLYEATKTVLVSGEDGFKVVIDGETLALTRDGYEDHDGIKCDRYVSGDGTSYVFDADGEILSVMYSLEEQMDASSLYMEGGLEAVSEDEAVGAAREILSSIFGSKTERAESAEIIFDETGVYSIRFYEMFGRDGNIRGLGYYVRVLPNGKIFSAGTSLSTLVKGLRVCDLDLFTNDYIDNAAQEDLVEKFGDDLISYTVDEITFKTVNGKLQVYAKVVPEVKNPENYHHLNEYLFFDIPGVSD